MSFEELPDPLADLLFFDLEVAGVVEHHPVLDDEDHRVVADIAVVIEKAVPFADLKVAINNACGDVLEKQWLFDVYDGKGIEAGSHSLAIALQLRKVVENFTDEEANQVRDRAVKALEEMGAKLR